MSLTEILKLLLQMAPGIAKLGMDAWEAYKRIVSALKIKAGSPEERAALDQVEKRMHELDVEVANAPEPT